MNKTAYEQLIREDVAQLDQMGGSLKSRLIESVLNEPARLPCGHQDFKILDACCGSRMFWFNKKEPHTTYMDIREESLTLCDGRTTEVKPDVIADCRNTPFPDNTFNLIIFDPPHLKWVGENSWMAHKYGKLPEDWKSFLKDSMDELMRVLKPGGTLIFKWNEHQIKVSSVLEAIKPYQPLFGHPTRRNDTTIWMSFMKFQEQ